MEIPGLGRSNRPYSDTVLPSRRCYDVRSRKSGRALKICGRRTLQPTHFMRIRRRLPLIIGLVAVIAAVVIVVELRKHAPPEPVRLLPNADAFFYINLSWIRRVNVVNQLPPVSHDPEYERFIQETGFQFERDLDRAAFAVHYPPGETGTPGSGELRFSDVIEGSIHTEKLNAYLRRTARSVDTYRSVDIFNIPLEGRTLRVAILGVDTVAASNHDDPMVIRGIIERSRKLASPFGGPAFLRQYYKHVPLASLTWAIVKVNPTDQRLPLSQGIWSLLFPNKAVVVASARYLTALHLRAEAFTESEDDAKRVTDQVSTFLSIFHTAESSASTQGTDKDVKEFFDSLKVEQKSDRAVLTANLPAGFVKKVFTESPVSVTPVSPPPKNAPEVSPGRKHRSPRPKSTTTDE